MLRAIRVSATSAQFDNASYRTCCEMCTEPAPQSRRAGGSIVSNFDALNYYAASGAGSNSNNAVTGNGGPAARG